VIESTHNPKIQWIRALNARSRQRRESGAFVVEGVRLVEEALLAGWEAQLVLHTGDLDARKQAILDGFAARHTPVEMVSEPVMRAASDTQTPQGLLAVLALRSLSVPEKPDFIFIPDGVRDPGNLGSMLRSAAAAGASLICLPAGTVDVFSPKVVRAGMGAHFRLPLMTGSWQEIADLLNRAVVQVYLAAAGQGAAYTQVDFRPPLALVVGGEASGAGDFVRSLPHQPIHIPMPGGVESLNAAAAAAVLMFEVVRQRTTSEIFDS
jgi:RNA methyltransferase, TrmH family